MDRTWCVLASVSALTLVACSPEQEFASFEDGEYSLEKSDGGVYNTRMCNSDCEADLALTKAATAKYVDYAEAIADGYVSIGACHMKGEDEVAFDKSDGGMGEHWLNLNDAPGLDVEAPELLLYEPDGHGGYDLVGVEWIEFIFVDGVPWVGDEAPPEDELPEVPVLFGHEFNGPMAGHEPGMPWHYDMHVWIYRDNPDGMFAQYNPDVVCPDADGGHH